MRGRLPYIRRYISVNKNVLSVSLNKILHSFLPGNINDARNISPYIVLTRAHHFAHASSWLTSGSNYIDRGPL